ncbi:hypothetical protein [Nonomuraea sp. GTA35]|uniref:hypothetical protein n=1 Tax=Nonomuraea sp. GTA35 TaxID=1676746 RepID=UPI0035C07F6D
MFADGEFQVAGALVIRSGSRSSRFVPLRDEGLVSRLHWNADGETMAAAVALDTDGDGVWETAELRSFDGRGHQVGRLPKVGAPMADQWISPSGRRFLADCAGRPALCVHETSSGRLLARCERKIVRVMG